MISRKYFGTNGIRGIPGKDFSIEFIAEMAQSIGTYLGNKRSILIGHDVRNSSPAISRAVSAGVMAAGSSCAESEMAPTPAHQYATRTLGYGGAIIITASHNPAEYNGMKVVGSDGVEIARETETEIESIYSGKNYSKADWKSVGTKVRETRVIENYIKGITSQVNVSKISERRFTIVLDIGNGAQAVAAPYLCERLGCRVITLNGNADGNFPGRGPEPSPSLLQDLAEAVKSYKADLGVAYDGDGDRSLFCDENGEIYWGDRTGSLLTRHLLRKHKGGPVVTTVSTSQLVGVVAREQGAKVIWTTVGSVDVSRAMIRNEAPLGLEENGGFFYGPHIPVRDGGMTTALVLDALASDEITFSRAIGSLPLFFQRKIKFECPNDRKNEVMESLEAAATHEGSRKVEKIDGLKIWIDETSWILLRPSGTEPLIRIYAESNDQSKLERMYGTFKGIVEDSIKSS
ncbi:MAG: phosphoglucosamine mutase [Nitrososphaerales archaeon]